MRAISQCTVCTNLTELWWDGEKQAILTVNGYSGGRADYEIFRDFCECIARAPDAPQSVRSRAQLRVLFGCDRMPVPANCQSVWRQTAQVLSERWLTRAEAFAVCNTLSKYMPAAKDGYTENNAHRQIEKAAIRAEENQASVATDDDNSQRQQAYPAGKDSCQTPIRDCTDWGTDLETGETGIFHSQTTLPAIRPVVRLNRIVFRDSNGWQSWAAQTEALLDRRLQCSDQTVLLSLPASFHPRRPDLYHIDRILGGQEQDDDLWLTQLACFAFRYCAARDLHPILQTACSVETLCDLLHIAIRMTGLPDFVWQSHFSVGLMQFAEVAGMLLRHRIRKREGIPPVLYAVPAKNISAQHSIIPRHLQIQVL